MTRMFMLAGVAALAIAMPASAEKGGKGGGHGNGSGHGQSHAQQSHGNGHGGHGRGQSAKPAKAERQAARAEVRQARNVERQARRAQVREVRRAERQAFRSDDRGRLARARERFDDRGRDFDRRRDFAVRNEVRVEGPRFARSDRFCPPGLAKKNNGCLPPGQAKKIYGLGDRLDRSWFRGAMVPVAYRDFYYDSPYAQYRYDSDGYVYRVDPSTDTVSGLIPLLGGGFAVGQPLPAGYDIYNVPMQYRDVYQDSDDSWYRYGDNAIYQVDPQSGTIESIVALLTGDLGVGQPLPAGYDAYNLPLDYRDDYVDNQDYLYRYGDGNIYQVDAKTQIIQAIVEMLV